MCFGLHLSQFVFAHLMLFNFVGYVFGCGLLSVWLRVFVCVFVLCVCVRVWLFGGLFVCLLSS